MRSRPFHFQVEKAIEVVAFLLRLEKGHRMNYMRLLKILYIAEREILADSGTPLTGSSVIAMERGPVLEDVLQLIRGEHKSIGKWAQFIRVDHYNLELVNDPGVRVLSKYTTRKLSEIATRYQDCDEWDMVRITHEFPEWMKNDPGTSSRRIPLADILQAVGRSKDLQQIVDDAAERQSFDAFFSEPCSQPTV